MAYFLPDDDEGKGKAQQPAPTLAPGAVSTGVDGPTISGGQPSKQQTPQQQQGSGTFTGLDKWLNAGAGRDKLVSDTGGSLLTTEKTKFDTAAKPLQDATFTPTTYDDNQVAGILYGGTPNSFSGKSAPVVSSDPDAWKKTLEGALTQDYTGPTSVDYDPSQGRERRQPARRRCARGDRHDRRRACQTHRRDRVHRRRSPPGQFRFWR
jgi:hypothetical protein